MKFKTLILTRKTIFHIISAVCAFAACTLCSLLLTHGGNESVEVFNYNAISYEDILKDGLPHSGSVTHGIIKTILGFDPTSPESIIENASAAYRSGHDYTPYAAEDNIDPPASDDMSVAQPPSEPSEPPPLPSHEAICSASGLKINNATNYDVDVDAMCAEELAIKPDSDAPQVLIVHTHTTECYDGDQMSGETERTTDENLNVVAVGDEICAVLESYGIKTIHDTTYHDYPSYQGSYSRALTTINNRLEEYPSIKAVLDIHRDAFVYSDGSKLTVSCDLGGVRTAQVMIVTGTDSMGLWHDNWRENLKFAAKIQSAAEIMYPGMMRPINLRTERFNGHTTMGSLILEVGSNGNTLDEAKEGGRNVARAVAAALING